MRAALVEAVGAAADAASWVGARCCAVGAGLGGRERGAVWARRLRCAEGLALRGATQLPGYLEYAAVAVRYRLRRA
jgi:hypothetical protein